MYFRQIHDTSSNGLTYILGDDDTGEAVVIDPLLSQTTLILAILAERNLRLRYVLRTHVHYPSRAVCGELCPSTGATQIVGENSPGSIVGERVTDGAVIFFGRESLDVITTPGHAPGCVCYLWHDRLFCGDTLLISGCDRLEEDADPGRLFDSVTQKLFSLPDETLVFPAHDSSGRTVSTICEERRRNPCFSMQSRDEFIATVRKQSGSLSMLLSHGQGKW